MFFCRNISQTIILLSIGVLPPLIGSLFGSTSIALGLFLSLIFLLILKLKRIKQLLSVQKTVFFWLIFFLIYAIFQHVLIGWWSFKGYTSFFALFLLFFVAQFFSKEIGFHEKISRRCIFSIFWFLVFILIYSILTNFKLGAELYGNNKSIFPFGEPSHFSLFFGPFFLMAVVLSDGLIKKLIIIGLIAFLAFLIPSTTLLIYVVLSLLLTIKLSVASFLFFTPIFIGLVYVTLENSYFLSRFILSSDSKNLTALVYLQGIQDSYNSFVSTNGLGLGFQMLGTQPKSIAGEQINYIMNGVDLNREDGGFTAAKIIAELGVFGFLILCIYLSAFFKSFLKLKYINSNGSKHSSSKVFYLCIIYASFVEFFVRGVGYFSPSLFLLFTAMFIYSISSRKGV